ncbi:MAG: peptidase, partial [Armatimonadetes bacterium]|nr:peptidase [Armatimonadota bacterium]
MRISLERLFQDPPVTGARISGIAWHPDGRSFTYLQPASEPDRPADLWSYSLSDGRRTLLASGGSLVPPGSESDAPVPLDGYRWLPDGERLLLAAKGCAWLLNRTAGAPELLLEGIDPDVAPHQSPAGDRLAFVREGNLWVYELASGVERRLTVDGSAEVLNGKLDWVYWEELGHRHGWRGFEWSPDGRSLAYLRLDQSRVPEYPLVDVMAVHPAVTFQRYPKAGDPNSTAGLYVASAEDGRTLAAHAEPNDDWYLAPGVAWSPDSRGVAYCRLSRDQRTLELRLLEPATGADRLLLTESDPHWLNAIGPPNFLPDGGFLWFSERTGHLHLYRYNADGECLHAVTSGAWQMETVHTIAHGWVYFSG